MIKYLFNKETRFYAILGIIIGILLIVASYVFALTLCSGYFLENNYTFKTTSITTESGSYSIFRVYFNEIGQNLQAEGTCFNGAIPVCYPIGTEFDMSSLANFALYGEGWYFLVIGEYIGGSWTELGYYEMYAYAGDNWTEELETDIWAISPESMTEITSLSTSFTFGWESVDDYDLMSVGFKHRGSGISSDYLTYDIDDLTGTSTTVNMDAFNIQNNGNWYFQGFVGTLTPEVLYGNTFSGNYMSSLSEDLAEDDNYYLTFNIEGLESIFIMPDFENWYSTNSTRYDSPTDMFVAITDLFTPIFSKIGEFGRRIQDYFDIDEAHQNGFDIGKSIPVFGYYLTQIGYFVGNFPFLKWFFIITLFFLGVFIFRLILKFIPGLG